MRNVRVVRCVITRWHLSLYADYQPSDRPLSRLKGSTGLTSLRNVVCFPPKHAHVHYSVNYGPVTLWRMAYDIWGECPRMANNWKSCPFVLFYGDFVVKICGQHDASEKPYSLNTIPVRPPEEWALLRKIARMSHGTHECHTNVTRYKHGFYKNGKEYTPLYSCWKCTAVVCTKNAWMATNGRELPWMPTQMSHDMHECHTNVTR